MALRIGELLEARGVLTRGQVEEILAAQEREGRPFGVLAERMFDVDPEVIEGVWAEQYADLVGMVSLSGVTPTREAREAVAPRQAWQFGIFPMREEDGELQIATTRAMLARALRFAVRVLERPCYFVLCDARELGTALETHYAFAGMRAGDLVQPLSA